VWVLPPVGLALSVAALVTVLWRRRLHRSSGSVSDDDRALVQRALAERSGTQARASEAVRAP
jgi:hypothetical protein